MLLGNNVYWAIKKKKKRDTWNQSFEENNLRKKMFIFVLGGVK